MDLALRPPRPGDGPGLARCWLDAGASYAALNPALFQVPSADGLAQSLEDRFLHLVATDALVLVADRAGQVVGYLIATIAPPSPRAAMDASRDAGLVRLVIDALIIREDSRHQGIGTQLMEVAERWGRGRGAAIVVLETYVDSPLSVPFYEQHLGYRRRAVLFRKDLR